MDLLASLYVPRSWSHYTLDPSGSDYANVRPWVQSATTSTFFSESPTASSIRSYLERVGEDQRQAMVRAFLIWDYELTAAGFPDLVDVGGHLEVLSANWRRHRAGSLVMTAFRKVARAGKSDRVVVETFVQT